MSRRVFAVCLVMMLVVLPAGFSLRADAPVYSVEDLGTIDGYVPTVTGLNASGQVSGYVTRDDGQPRAVRFTDGIGWSYVPGLEGFYSAATAINASGDMTGYFISGAGLRAFRYSNGAGLATIPALPGGSFAIGLGINATGDVVGYGNSAAGTRAWRAHPGLAPEVPTILADSPANACGINDGGQVVGWFTTAAGFQHAFRLETDDTLTDIGTLEGPSSNSSACAIDADGHVGGRSGLGDATHAVVSTGGAPVDVDSFGSSFSQVESTFGGVSVGMFTWSAAGDTHAFVHTAADGTVDLNDRLPAGSGWTLSDATAVNASGKIAGVGVVAGAIRAFRLTPSAVATDTTAPVITSLSANPSSVTPPNKTLVPVTISATATDDKDPNPACAVTSADGHGAPAADFAITGPFSGNVRATGGALYSFTVTCRDAAGNHAERSVDVVVPPDTAPPSITSLSVTPSTVAPPNNALVPVTVSVSANDNSGDAPACALSAITASGSTADDYSITGQYSGKVRAVSGRTYSLRVTCSDASGNKRDGYVAVVVPPDTIAPTINAVSVTPDFIWPPNGKMVSVTVSVSATDDVDASPTCGLTSIDGASAADAVMTGRFTATVRANKDAVYTLNLACGDRAGNASGAAITVAVSKEPPSAKSGKARWVRCVLTRHAKWLRGRHETQHGRGEESKERRR